MITHPEQYDLLEKDPVDGLCLDKMVDGFVVTGAEPINYPETDGVIFYLRGKDDKLLVLEVGVLIDDENQFYIDVAAC